MKKSFILSFSILLLAIIQPGQAQELEDYLKDILEGNGQQEAYLKGYVQPLSTALGTSLGGALYHRGYTKGFPRFDVGISATYISIPDNGLMFDNPLKGLPGASDQVPTFFGKNNPAGTGAVSGINSDLFALPMLHANIGLVGNLEATARYASWTVSDIGEIGLYGGGLKYGLSDLIPIPLFPIDFSVQAAYHKFTVGEILDAGTFSMNFQASASLPLTPIDFYTGIGFDNSSLTIKTDAISADGGIGDISIDGENSVRFNAGVSFTLLFFNVHADYTMGEYNSINGGLMLVL